MGVPEAVFSLNLRNRDSMFLLLCVLMGEVYAVGETLLHPSPGPLFSICMFWHGLFVRGLVVLRPRSAS